MPHRPASVPRVYILTLGCPKNDADSRNALRRLTETGVQVVEEPGQATHILVNTCGFIQDAKEESIAAILDACAGYPDREVLAMGCLVERYRTELEQGIPEVAGWFGLAETDKLVARLSPDSTVRRTGSDRAAADPNPARTPRALRLREDLRWLRRGLQLLCDTCDQRRILFVGTFRHPGRGKDLPPRGR